MTEPLVPNPNIRPPDLKPRSTDDYTPTEGTPVKGQTHPAIKYSFIDDEGKINGYGIYGVSDKDSVIIKTK